MNSPGSALPVLPVPLLRRHALRYALRHPWQTWLSFLGIMLGVMMVVAVDLANGSARRAFELSLEAVNGRITHQIRGGPEGVPDTLFTALRTELGLRASAPALSGRVRAGGRSFTLLGVDPLSEGSLERGRAGVPDSLNQPGPGFLSIFTRPDAVLMSAASAAALGLEEGESFALLTPQGERMAFLGLVFEGGEAAEGLILADIAVAQRLLGRLGRLDSIDLALDPDDAARLGAWLPPAYALVEAERRSDSLRQLTEAFHVNLLAMSLLSLLVAALLIYNTMTLSVLQRRPVLGTLRSLGVGRAELFVLVLGEAAVLGLAAGLAGLVGGLLLGRFLVTLVTRTIDDVYFSLSVRNFAPDWQALAFGLLLGVGVSVLAATLPALHAARSQPATLQRRLQTGAFEASRLRPFALLGMVLMGAGLLTLLADSLVAGFVALTLLIFGFCFLVPGLMAGTLAILLRVLDRRLGTPARMALRGIHAGIGRTGLAVAALTVAVSVTVGVGLMVGSFRGTVVVWLEQSLGGDVQLGGEAITPALAARISALPEVEGARGIVMHEVESARGPVRLQASDGTAAGQFYLKDGVPADPAAWERGEGILVSEPFAWLEDLAPGDVLRVFTPAGPRDFGIVGVFHDYTSSLGLVALHESLYRRWWGPRPPSRLSLTAAPGVEATELMARVRALLGEVEGELSLTANRDIRRLTLDIFDRTFAITNVLRLLAIVVAFAGVLSALMALQLERLREYAILRATGMTPAQVAALVLGQTGVMGLFAGLLSIPLGLLMSDVLIDVINRRSFGWSMQHLLPPGVFAEALLLALGAALLAGLYPAWRAMRMSPALALREE